MGRSILACLETCMGAGQDDGPVGFFCNHLTSLVSDGMETRSDVSQGRHECRIGGTHAYIVSEAGDPAQSGGDGILADPADGEQSGPRVSSLH